MPTLPHDFARDFDKLDITTFVTTLGLRNLVNLSTSFYAALDLLLIDNANWFSVCNRAPIDNSALLATIPILAAKVSLAAMFEGGGRNIAVYGISTVFM